MPMRLFPVWGALFMLLATGALADDIAALEELAPTGKLRAAIAWAPAPSALYALKEETTGKYRGVTIDLSTELAKKLAVPLELVLYLASGEIQNSAAAGVWDVTFMPVDEERKKFVDFGNAYHLLQSTYLAAPSSSIHTIEQANKAGVRICGVKDTATFRASNRASPNATHIALVGVGEAVTRMKAGDCDIIPLSRESLTGIATSIPGSRILDGGILNSMTAAAVPKNKQAALAYVSAFIEEAKASGLVRRGLDNVGLKASQIAPAGMKP
jgi:polar amino acid transport system substrate-binding protein